MSKVQDALIDLALSDGYEVMTALEESNRVMRKIRKEPSGTTQTLVNRKGTMKVILTRH